MKTDDELEDQLQTYGPVCEGHEPWPHLDLALFKASQREHAPRLHIKGNVALLGHTIEADQVCRLIERARSRWATRGHYP